jgi:peroxiredoxin
MRLLGVLFLSMAALATGQNFTAREIKGLTEDPSLLRGGVTVVTFISARCPISNAYGDRLEAVYEDYAPREVRFLFVNSNLNESQKEMGESARSHGFTFPIYQDVTSAAAIRFNAQFTPETFVIDKTGTIVYHGAVDDSQNPARVHTRSLRAALDAVLAGKPVPVPETKAFGCTIKKPRRTT